MSLFQSLYRWVGKTFRLSDDVEWNKVRGSVTGRSMTANDALCISTWWACTRLLSETVGGLPLGIFEDLGDGDSRRAEDHDLWFPLHMEPNIRQTTPEYIGKVVFDICREGNSFSLIEPGPSLQPFEDPSQMQIITKSPNGQPLPKWKFTYPVNGRVQEYQEDEILHVKGFGAGVRGLSPSAYASRTLALTDALEEFGALFFGNGSHLGGWLETDAQLTKEQRELYKKNFEDSHQGLENSHKLGLLTHGFKYKANSLPNDEAQFIESRREQVREICKWHLIPVSAITEGDNQSYLSNEANLLFLQKFCLMPYCIRIEKAMGRALLKLEEKRRFFIKFNFDALLRADTAARIAYFSGMVQNGILNRNECRVKEGFNRSTQTGMDDHTAQVNMAPVGELQKVTQGSTLPVRQ